MTFRKKPGEPLLSGDVASTDVLGVQGGGGTGWGTWGNGGGGGMGNGCRVPGCSKGCMGPGKN